MQFEISEKRFVIVKKDEVCLIEEGSHKAASFTYPRWVWFTEQFDEIDNSLSKLINGDDDVKLNIHIGGGWYVSVTSGYWCIDVRKFYKTRDNNIKPTRKGFAIRINEWDGVKKIARDVKKQKMADVHPCWTGEDHYNQEGAMTCTECNPFGNWFNLN